MTSQSERLAELLTLIEALCEESISLEQLARLEDRLRCDPMAEEVYIGYMLIHSKLLQEFGGTSIVPGREPASARVVRWHRPIWPLAAVGCVIVLLVGGFFAWRWSGDGPLLPRPRAYSRAGPGTPRRR